ncbi:acyl-CoA dehydrogenase family protein [Halopseudomonas bauzanensis]|uniref:Acyl-CoA dehydrogenase n=1 Tax=Halopseudomonas bauzanensis TaxID=653930 RepID=A0A4U0YJJ5_9GAMM|nr:acyl-CoA dehydrogenase family protein [Halopseudomonas bauzanensis]TKA92240.1 acyl-CoA dehydrogenase [Halopseudomonas bauzanensis]
MLLTPTDLQEMIESSVLGYLKHEYDFIARASSLSATNGINATVWQNFADMGWLGLPVAEENGGIGGGPMEAGLLMRAFGQHLVVEPYLACVLRATRLLQATASAAQKSQWLPALVTGEKRLVLAHEERFESAPWAPRATRATRATRDAEGYLLTGSKVLVAGTPGADALIVSAELEGGGCGLFLVEPDNPGVTLSAQRTLDSAHAADLTLNQVRIVDDALLGDPSSNQAVLDEVIAAAIIAECWEATGAMQAALEQTAAYVCERQQFGKPLSSFQVVQHRLAEMAVACEDSLAVCQLAALRSQDDPRCARQMSALARSKVGRCAREVSQAAVQLHGAMGVSEELMVASLFRKLLAFHQQHGTTAAFTAAYGNHMLETGTWRNSQVLPAVATE